MLRQFGPGLISKQQVRCDVCHGEGEVINPNDRCLGCAGNKVKDESKVLKVEIDKGTMDGKKIAFRGEADEAPDMQTGDIIFVVKEKDHPVFERQGNHLFMQKTIPLVNALTGFSMTVKHLDDREILIKCKPGEVIEPGATKEILNEGMPQLNQPYLKGSLYIKFDVEFPKTLTADQMAALKKALPGAMPEVKKTADMETVELHEVDPSRLRDDGTRGGGRGHNAYDESDSEGEEGGVRCAQQ
jgi:DnaJ family protein A protein 2